MTAGSEFPRSSELKRFFREQYERWREVNRGGLEELARRCGVSASYLGHVSRYGRVPGRPVLILLALNFKLKTPQQLFDAAGVSEAWPLRSGVGLGATTDSDPGFVTLKIDMDGLTASIRDIVRAEVKPRRVADLVQASEIRVGFNAAQSWMFADAAGGGFQGVFPELFSNLALALRKKCAIEAVHFGDYQNRLEHAEVDIYGPVASFPKRLGSLHYTRPFCRVALAALGRRKPAKRLPELPQPASLAELQDPRYRIAVLSGTNAHNFANSRLGRSDTELVVCEDGDETLERLILANIKNPAHLVLIDAPLALAAAGRDPENLELLFGEPESVLGWYENTIAVRPDWREMAELFSESIKFLAEQGTLQDLFRRHVPPTCRPFVVPAL